MSASDLVQHYGSDSLLARIREALEAAGCDPDTPRPSDLKPVDEFHTGGIEATEYLLSGIDIGPETRVLDIGSGIGGTARHIVERTGAHVTGIDMTRTFVETADALSRMCGLSARTEFVKATALALPLAASGFDLATLLHVGMNIEDKDTLFREAARVLKPGGRLAIYDIMEGPDGGEIVFPVPWSPDAAHSFVEPPERYRQAARDAGFVLEAEEDRGDYARAFFRSVIAKAKAEGPPPIGLHILMGSGAEERYVNAATAALSGAAAPWQMIFRKPGG